MKIEEEKVYLQHFKDAAVLYRAFFSFFNMDVMYSLVLFIG